MFDKYVHHLRKSDWDKHKAFVMKVHGQKSLLNNKRYVFWKFRSPYVDSDTSMLLFENKGRILSQLGLIPIKLKLFHKTVNAAFLTDLFAREEVKGLGFGAAMVKKTCEDESIDVSLNLDYTMDAQRILKKLKWVELRSLNHYALILDKEEKNLTSSISNRYSEYKFDEIRKFGKDVNVFWYSIKGKYPITTERRAIYLNWRYVNHPLINYHVFVVRRERKISSYIILTIKETDGFRVAAIVDFIAEDHVEEFTLLKLIEFCKKKEIDFMEFLCTGNFHKNSLEAVGFSSTHPYPIRERALRTLFNFYRELEPSVCFRTIFNFLYAKNIRFAFKTKKKDHIVEKTLNKDNWYITMGDSDIEKLSPQVSGILSLCRFALMKVIIYCRKHF